MSDERKFMEAVLREREEELRFFSNAAKPERERWVVSEFLAKLGVTFEQQELLSLEQDDPVDVLFRDARFQVKEVADPQLRRGEELKADLRRAQQVERASELFAVGEPRDIILSNAYRLMLDVAASSNYPPAVKRDLDLLFYVTRPYSGRGSDDDMKMLAAAGWRSISCLHGESPLLIATTETAPIFLR